MSTARDDVLARVRAALGRPGAGGTTAEVARDVEVPRAYRTAGSHATGSREVLDLLVDRLVDYRAHVRRVPGAEVPGALAEILSPAGRGLDAAGERTVVVPAGLDRSWLTGLATDVVLVDDSRDAPRSAAELDAASAVVTAARLAIAETGTIVLDGEPGQGRRAISLVPDVHVCVVRADQVVETVPEAVRLLGAHPERPLTWISGPSATSDIELDRVEGVHGPRTLHVLLVTAS